MEICPFKQVMNIDLNKSVLNWVQIITSSNKFSVIRLRFFSFPSLHLAKSDILGVSIGFHMCVSIKNSFKRMWKSGRIVYSLVLKKC